METGILGKQIRRVAVVSHSRSSGPGGQNVNKVNTRVTLHVPLHELGLQDEERELVKRILKNRVTRAGDLVVHSAFSRSQARNLERAFERALELIENARIVPAPPHRPTRPGIRARERRLQAKHEQAAKKAQRRQTDW